MTTTAAVSMCQTEPSAEPIHPVAVVRGQLTAYKPLPSGMVELGVSIEVAGDPVGRVAISYFNPTLVDPKNPALGVQGFVADDAVRPHAAGGLKWTQTVPRGQAITLLVWSKTGQVRTVPLFDDVAREGTFSLRDRQVTLSF